MFFFFRLKGIFSPILVIYVMCVWTRRRIMNADLSRELLSHFHFFPYHLGNRDKTVCWPLPARRYHIRQFVRIEFEGLTTVEFSSF